MDEQTRERLLRLVGTLQSIRAVLQDLAAVPDRSVVRQLRVGVESVAEQLETIANEGKNG